MDKLQMAHEYARELTANFGDVMQFSEILAKAWWLADAMQAEADKRKETGLPESIKNAAAFPAAMLVNDFKKNCLNPNIEWQPDWSQAPEWANAWHEWGDGTATWYDEFENHKKCCEAPIFDYTGHWINSLRKRP